MASFASATSSNMWQRSVWNEVRNAWSERRQVLGQSTKSAFSVGDAGYLTVRDMQEWIENNCTSFADPDETYEGESFDNWGDGVYGDPTTKNYTWESLKSAMGISGWRRKTTLGGSYSHGRVQSGDIVGPWILEDLQSAFEKLIWTQTHYSVKSTSEDKEGYGSDDGSTPEGGTYPDDYNEASFSDAISDAEANYQLQGTLTDGARAYLSGDWDSNDLLTSTDASIKGCTVDAVFSLNTGLYSSLPLAADVDIYVYTQASSGATFYAYTTGLLEDQWHKIGTLELSDGDSGDNINVHTVLAATSYEWPATPTQDDTSTAKGFHVYAVNHLVKWNFSYS